MSKRVNEWMDERKDRRKRAQSLIPEVRTVERASVAILCPVALTLRPSSEHRPVAQSAVGGRRYRTSFDCDARDSRLGTALNQQ